MESGIQAPPARCSASSMLGRGRFTTGQPVPDASDWTRVGGQQGSNPAAFYVDAGGTKWYIKELNDDARTHNEVAANMFYRTMGIGAPEVRLAIRMGRLVVASRFVAGLTPR